jgi:enoyl-[acyl-carrier protein] reductase I
MSGIIQKGLLAGKRGLVMGVANEMSLAWPIAELAYQQGAELAFTYPSEMMRKYIEPLAKRVNASQIKPCEVKDENSIKQLFEDLGRDWGEIDFLVHSIAFSDKEELKGKYLNTSLDNFLNTMHISCYSLTSIARYAQPLMQKGGSIITLTYYGAEKAMPNYNVMGVAKAALEASVRYLAVDLGTNGVRVNAISAGPVRTLAASAIGGFRDFLRHHQHTSPLGRNTTGQDVAGSALYLLSDLASGVTGEILHVDSGFHAVGMKIGE